jgi:hypothetical protein
MEPNTEYYSVSSIAERWGCSVDKASRVVSKFRGRAGFLDLASKKRNRRKYSIIRVHRSLLKEIEGSLA